MSRVPPPEFASRAKLAALALLVSLLASLCLGLLQTSSLRGDPEARYADAATPMLASFDSYYYLRLSQDYAAGRYTREDPLAAFDRPMPAPLMVSLAAGLSKLFGSGVSLEAVAFVFPAAAAATLAGVVLLWALLLTPARQGWGGFVPLATCALAATLSPYWVETASVGAFDTNALIPQFFLLAGWHLYKFVLTPHPRRWLFLAGYLLVCLLFGRWWTPGYGAGLLFLGAYGATAFVSSSRGERAVKLVLFSTTLLGCGFALFGPPAWLPGRLAEPLRYAHNHLALTLKLQGGGVGGAIIELTGLSLAELAAESAGRLPVFLAALGGIALAGRRNPAAFCFLVPFLGFGVMSLTANRYVTLFFPLVALGLGLVVDFAQELTARWRLRLAGAAATLCACLALAPLVMHGHSFVPTLQFHRAEDGLALAIRSKTSARALVWSWWDYGYFLQCRAGRATFFDGGSQTLDRCYVAGRGLTAADPAFAANWIRFFAARGVKAWYELSKQCGGDAAAIRFLEEGLGRKRDAAGLRAAYPGLALQDIEGYLFPEQEVCLYLPWSLVRINGHWLSHGAGAGSGPVRVRNHADLFPKEGFVFDFARSRATLSPACKAKGYEGFETVLRAPAAGLDPAVLEDKPAPFLLVPDESPYAFIADKAAASSLVFQLLVLRAPLPGFELLTFDAQAGGVWRVRGE